MLYACGREGGEEEVRVMADEECRVGCNIMSCDYVSEECDNLGGGRRERGKREGKIVIAGDSWISYKKSSTGSKGLLTSDCRGSHPARVRRSGPGDSWARPTKVTWVLLEREG